MFDILVIVIGINKNYNHWLDQKLASPIKLVPQSNELLHKELLGIYSHPSPSLPVPIHVSVLRNIPLSPTINWNIILTGLQTVGKTWHKTPGNKISAYC